MKIIFLDIDGVLNYLGCKSRCQGCYGIEDDKLELLKKIVDATNAKIVLTSTWKSDWENTEYIEDLNTSGQYMVRKFKEHGLSILAKTIDEEWSKRGKGILDFINHFPANIESFVILDDESFDFEFVGIDDKFVHTDFTDNGLTEENVSQAIRILNGDS